MLTFGYDWIRHDEGPTWIDLYPNCALAVERALHWSMRRFHPTYLPGMAIWEPERFRCASISELLRTGAPFIYPLEFWYTMPDSLARLPSLAPDFPNPVADRVRAGRASVLIWIAHEVLPYEFGDNPRISVFDLVQQFIHDHELPPQHVWFVSGNIAGHHDFMKWASDRGHHAAETFQFRGLAMSPTTVRMNCRAGLRGVWVSEGVIGDDFVRFSTVPLTSADITEAYLPPSEIVAERNSGRLRPKRFLSMNLKPRLHRQLLAAFLQGKGFLEDSYVSFGAPPGPLPGLSNFPGVGRLLEEGWNALQPKLPLALDRPGSHAVLAGWPYRGSYFNLVTETAFADAPPPVITEKPLKPMVNFQPFIMLGSPHSLRYLSSRGFKTYASLVDESYDGINNPVERLARIFEQIDRLGSISQAEARDRYFACLPEMEHNRAHLLEGRHELDEVFDAMEAQIG